VLEEPKIKPYIIQMQEVISAILEVSADDVSVKATTNEKLGYVGTRDGVDAYAVALLYRNND
jgi:2-C-methyl-D-erythritol 2,4-cyclodiphosphate synthase